MKTTRYIRRPFTVEAVQVTVKNLDEVLLWVDGSREVDDKGDVHIRVKVRHPLTSRQTRAYMGDWVLKAGEGFKVYNEKAFEKSFQLYNGEAIEQVMVGGSLVHYQDGFEMFLGTD